MSTAAVLQPHDVPTTLNYYVPAEPLDETPFYYRNDPPEGKPRSNIGRVAHDVVIHDARGHEHELTLDTAGFQFVKHVSQEKEFEDDERIQDVYYKEVEDILKKETGAKRVFIFDHTLRLRPERQTETGRVIRGPSDRVHVDQTFDAAVKRVHYHLGDEADRLLQGRVRLINVWRPIHHPVAHHPLAVGDWRSLDPKNDLVASRLIYPDRVGETFAVKYNPNHKFWYLSNQTPEEVILIKCFDSKEDRARLTPHTAFPDSTSPKDAPPRESIEVRALVFDTE